MLQHQKKQFVVEFISELLELAASERRQLDTWETRAIMAAIGALWQKKPSLALAYAYQALTPPTESRQPDEREQFRLVADKEIAVEQPMLADLITALSIVEAASSHASFRG
jgi:hypothetical protein